MVAAVAGPAQASGDGFAFLLEDMHSETQGVALQARYEAMSQAEKHRYNWLQDLSNAFLLYRIEKIIDTKPQQNRRTCIQFLLMKNVSSLGRR